MKSRCASNRRTLVVRPKKQQVSVLIPSVRVLPPGGASVSSRGAMQEREAGRSRNRVLPKPVGKEGQKGEARRVGRCGGGVQDRAQRGSDQQVRSGRLEGAWLRDRGAFTKTFQRLGLANFEESQLFQAPDTLCKLPHKALIYHCMWRFVCVQS